MEITNRALTVVETPATGVVNCLAGCSIVFNALEIASLNGIHPGFRLNCVLVANDPGPADRTVFRYPRTATFNDPFDLTALNQVFEVNISRDMLDEDPGPNADEIQAEFTLVDMSNGQSLVQRSNQVQRPFRE